MNRTETLAVMSILKAAYPAYYRDMKRQDAEAVVNLWAEMLADYPANLVTAAVKSHIASDRKGFPPHIGAIIAAIGEISRPAELSEGEAWALIAKALRNSGYNSEKEFAALPENLQRLVGHPSQLREWASMDTGTVQSVVQSNFTAEFPPKRRIRQTAMRCRKSTIPVKSCPTPLGRWPASLRTRASPEPRPRSVRTSCG